MTDATAPREAFALARQGLPLSGGRVPSQPRAAWLPAGARSPVRAVPPRAVPLQAAPDEEDLQPEDLPAEGDRRAAAAAREPAAAPTPALASQAHGEVVEAGRLPAGPVPRASPGDVVPFHARLAPLSRPAEASMPAAREAGPAAGIAAAGPAPHLSMAVHEASEARARSVPRRDEAVAARVPPEAQRAVTASMAMPSERDPVAPGAVSTPATVEQVRTIAVPLMVAAAAADREDGMAVAAPAAAPAAPATRASSPGASASPAPPARVPSWPSPSVPMGPAPALQAAAREAAEHFVAPDLAPLLQPAPAPRRTVMIERVSVTVQAPPAPATAPAPAMQPAAALRTVASPARAAVRHPWASYHLRRD